MLNSDPVVLPSDPMVLPSEAVNLLRLSWAIYHNPPTGEMIAPVPFQTKEDADRALELAERFGLRWAYVDKA